MYGTVLAPPGKVSSTLAPVLGVYGERWELGKKLSFQGGLLQKLNPDAFAKPGSSFADKFPTALYGEVTYTRELNSGYELSVTFSLKLSTDEIGQGPQQPSRTDMFSDRVRDSLKAGGGRTESGQTPQPGDVPTMIGVTPSPAPTTSASKRDDPPRTPGPGPALPGHPMSLRNVERTCALVALPPLLLDALAQRAVAGLRLCAVALGRIAAGRAAAVLRGNRGYGLCVEPGSPVPWPRLRRSRPPPRRSPWLRWPASFCPSRPPCLVDRALREKGGSAGSG